MLSPLANTMIANLGYGACSSAVTTWESKLHLHSREIEPDVVRAFECPSEIAYRFTLSVANIFSALVGGEITEFAKSRSDGITNVIVSYLISRKQTGNICASRRHQARIMQTQLLEELGRYRKERIIIHYVPKLSFISWCLPHYTYDSSKLPSTF